MSLLFKIFQNQQWRSTWCHKRLSANGNFCDISRNFSSEGNKHDNDFVSVNFTNGVKTITMCNQQTRNSLSIEMMQNIVNELKDSKDINIRAIVIAALGKVYSAGHNLKELSSLSGETTHKEVFQVGKSLMEEIINCPVPVIAKVNGVAAAAGCQLVAQCDLAICTKNSTFSTPGVNFGIFCSTPGIALVRSIPKSTAMRMLLTGRPISAEEAKQCGLVVEVCEENELDNVVNTYCDQIRIKSREVIRIGKEFFYKQVDMNLIEAYEAAGKIMVENLQLADGKEGIRSFIDKRKPNWSHG